MFEMGWGRGKGWKRLLCSSYSNNVKEL